ncbi:MAG: hypothetical protein KatS3mg068_2088 [Candidatus Sericytochromatia bacterium]|nr:MAG: hypothetical protein KatS3mg068_2088 [Candidatus Sericytochromatia bacterium]
MNRIILEKDFKKLRDKILEKFLSIKEEFFLSTTNKISLDKEKEELFLKEIFDLGRVIGLEILKEKDKELSLKEILDEIYKLNISCFKGDLKIDNNFIKIERTNCPYTSANYFICLYWREFIDGFIMGIGNKERYSRHASIKYGLNNFCTDIIYYNNDQKYRWSNLPEDVLNFIKLQNKKYSVKNIQIEGVGFNERTLFYKIKDNSSISSFRKGFIIESFAKEFKKRFPKFNSCEISPRSVIEGDF